MSKFVFDDALNKNIQKTKEAIANASQIIEVNSEAEWKAHPKYGDSKVIFWIKSGNYIADAAGVKYEDTNVAAELTSIKGNLTELLPQTISTVWDAPLSGGYMYKTQVYIPLFCADKYNITINSMVLYKKGQATPTTLSMADYDVETKSSYFRISEKQSSVNKYRDNVGDMVTVNFTATLIN